MVSGRVVATTICDGIINQHVSSSCYAMGLLISMFRYRSNQWSSCANEQYSNQCSSHSNYSHNDLLIRADEFIRERPNDAEDIGAVLGVAGYGEARARLDVDVVHL